MRTTDFIPTLSNMLDEVFGTDIIERKGDTSFVPRTNFHEDKDTFNFEFLLPGFNKKDLTIDVKEDKLLVEAKSSSENETVYKRKEFGNVHFKRTFQWPKNGDLDKVNAKYENGILFVSIAKKEIPNNSKRVEII